MKKILLAFILTLMLIPTRTMAQEKPSEYIKNYEDKYKIIQEEDDKIRIVSEKVEETNYIVDENTLILNTKTKKIDKKEEINNKELIIFSRSDRPMTLQFPAKIKADVIIIVDEKSSVEVGKIEKDQIEDKLIITNTKDVEITDLENQKQDFKNIEGKIVAVLYKIATRSIPPQTNAEKIIVLSQDLLGEEIIAVKEDKGYPLRDNFEKEGYQVDYNKDSKEITIEKLDTKIQINTKRKTYTKNNKEYKIDLEIIKGKTYIR